MTSNNNDRIRGKVAGILTRRELLINRGKEDGVKVGMRFAVLNEHGIQVNDPDTDAPLGTVNIVKTVVKVVRLEGEHLAVGRTFRTIPGSPGVFGAAINLAGTADRPETLEIDDRSTLKEELDPKDSYVAIGDLVVEAKGDEYDEA